MAIRWQCSCILQNLSVLSSAVRSNNSQIKSPAKPYFIGICGALAEKEGFEPSRRFKPPYALSRGASSASLSTSPSARPKSFRSVQLWLPADAKPQRVRKLLKYCSTVCGAPQALKCRISGHPRGVRQPARVCGRTVRLGCTAGPIRRPAPARRRESDIKKPARPRNSAVPESWGMRRRNNTGNGKDTA